MVKKGDEYLPDECWEWILSRLDQHSDIESPSLVCKRFLSITNRLRNSFTISNSTIVSDGTLSKLFCRFPNIKSIDLSSYDGDLDLAIRQIATSSLNLETLDISRNKSLPLEGLKLLGLNMNIKKSLRVLNCKDVEKICGAELIAIANSMPWLEELDISYNDGSRVDITDDGIEALSSKLRGLRKIDISGCEFLTDRSLVSLSSNCTHLENVMLGCPLVTQDGIQVLVCNTPKLSWLAIHEWRADHNQIQIPLVDSLACARSLSVLQFFHSSISDECLCHLGKSGLPLKTIHLHCCVNFTFSGISFLLQSFQSLEDLALVSEEFVTDNYTSYLSNLTDHDMSYLSKYLCSLVKIDLRGCGKLTDSTLFTLAKNCPLLEYVDMCVANLGGGETNVDMFKNQRIKSLKLAGNSNLSDECLGRIVAVCPSLELLDVSHCSSITDHGIAEVLKASYNIRHLRIIFCRHIKKIGTGFKLPKLEVLLAGYSGIDDEGLEIIGNTCCGLLNLDLQYCRVTNVGLKETLSKCKRLKKINLKDCPHVSMEVIEWAKFSCPSLREIIPSN